MVFVGSNEGFLHGFNANPDPAKDGGREIFAFAPYASLSQLGETVVSALSNAYDTRVSITEGRKKGRIVIEFAGADDLQRIADLILR